MSFEVRAVSKAFGSTELFRNLSLSFGLESITVILGPSGSGKTTLLNMLAGTLAADEGGISLPGSVSYLFQEPRLLPWRSVERNLEFVLPQAMPKAERRERVQSMLGMVELYEFRHQLPGLLSGGMRQRAALARAFIYPSSVLLMDEPFQALDLSLKLSLVDAFRLLWERDRRGVVFVTHDIQESVLLADRILVFSKPVTRVVDDFTVDIPRSERFLGHEALLGLERRLYTDLTGRHYGR